MSSSCIVAFVFAIFICTFVSGKRVNSKKKSALKASSSDILDTSSATNLTQRCVVPTLYDVEKYVEVEWAAAGCSWAEEKTFAASHSHVPAHLASSPLKCPFWDACPVMENGECPQGCQPYAKGLKATRAQRAVLWVGAKAARFRKGESCAKVCRYLENDMLESPKVLGFFATSIGVLQTKVAKQKEDCTKMLSGLNPMCGLRMRKIGALLSFVMRNVVEAEEQNSVAACKARFPLALATQVADAVHAAMTIVDYTKINGMDQAQQDGVRRMELLVKTWKQPDFCETAQKRKRHKTIDRLQTRRQELEAKEEFAIGELANGCAATSRLNNVEKEWCEAGEALQKLHEVGRDEDSPANGHYASKAVYDSRVELDEVLTANGIEEDVATELNGKHYGEIEVSSLLHANFTEGRMSQSHMESAFHERSLVASNHTNAVVAKSGGWVDAFFLGLFLFLFKAIIGTILGAFSMVACFCTLGGVPLASNPSGSVYVWNCPGEMLYTWANLEADWLGLSMDCVECAAFGPGGGRNTRKNPCYWC